MKVLLINGSPNEKGCTYTALCEAANVLHEAGIETQMVHVGANPVPGCIGCGACFAARAGKCLAFDDLANQVLALMQECDGMIVGSPVHYAAASGSITGLLDRVFYSGSRALRGKPGAALVSARRAGTTAALDQLQKYFIISGMPIAPSQYWPMVHGNTPEEVAQDEEGLQTVRQLARNMAWMTRSFALAKEHGILPPETERPRKRTNFIR